MTKLSLSIRIPHGGYSQKSCVGICDPLPKTLTLFGQNLRLSPPYWPDHKFETILLSWCTCKLTVLSCRLCLSSLWAAPLPKLNVWPSKINCLYMSVYNYLFLVSFSLNLELTFYSVRNEFSYSGALYIPWVGRTFYKAKAMKRQPFYMTTSISHRQLSPFGHPDVYYGQKLHSRPRLQNEMPVSISHYYEPQLKRNCENFMCYQTNTFYVLLSLQRTSNN